MNTEEIHWLTWGAIQHRPAYSTKWDEPGTAKAIRDLCGTWDLVAATEHVLAHARDPKAKTPFVIKGNRPNIEHINAGPWTPPKIEQICLVHPGEHRDSCRMCRADLLAGDTTPRPHESHGLSDDARADVLAAIECSKLARKNQPTAVKVTAVSVVADALIQGQSMTVGPGDEIAPAAVGQTLEAS